MDNSFLKNEVREGFYIPSMVKKSWAAELLVLKEVDKVCKKHNIQYFAGWGTLLGAVRHAGFIPWDDDFDICMKREDYIKFCECASKDLPEGYDIINIHTRDFFDQFLARVVSSSRINFDEDYLEQFNGFPYMVGIDIFVLDYMYADEEKEKKREDILKVIVSTADTIRAGSLHGNELEKIIRSIEDMCNVHLDRSKKLDNQLFCLAEKIFAEVPEKDARELRQISPYVFKGYSGYRFPKEYFEKSINIPFEYTTIPVSAHYDEILKKNYGDYMQLVRDAGGHDYPYFASQHKQLEETLKFAVPDFIIPQYKFSQSILDGMNEKADISGTYKESIKMLLENVRKLHDMILCNSEYTIPELLTECQENVMLTGELIEEMKGEGHVTISFLEKYCEDIYNLYQKYSDGEIQDLSEITGILQKDIKEAEKCINDSILNRKEIVFILSEYSSWSSFESVWKEAVKDESCDVYVIPVPYYYKKYDGTLKDMCYDLDMFPDEVNPVWYDTFDVEKHYPDMIFINSPYDAYDATTTVPKEFYSDRLRKYTKKLVYIPSFLVYEFSSDNYREYYNMQYYCTMPGVIYSDKVIVQSENMRDLYIQKLTEFAGENTRSLWEEKISAKDSPICDYEVAHKKDYDLPKDIFCKSTGEYKKIILYYTSVTMLSGGFDVMAGKLRSVISIFKDNRENIAVIWCIQDCVRNAIDNLTPEQKQTYQCIVDEFKSTGNVLILYDDFKKAVDMCDAYYGDASWLANMCRYEGKPVMIQDCGC
jgi:phosphorylcholine metabolism protein LicD